MARKKLPFWMSFGILIVFPTVGSVLAYKFIPFWVQLRGLQFDAEAFKERKQHPQQPALEDDDFPRRKQE